MFSLNVTQAAELDIIEASLWYEQQKQGLSDLFHNALIQAFKKIVMNPDIYHFETEDVRCYWVKHFPFKVLFHVKGSTIEVLAVFHKSRNPTDWLKRN